MSEPRTRVVGRVNLRDLGGLRTSDGRVVLPGRVFRSGLLHELSDDVVSLLHSLGIQRVVDLRSASERADKAGLALPGTAHLWLDVLGDRAQAGPARLGEALRQPAEASRQLGGGRSAEVFRSAYRDLVSTPLARAAYGRLVTELAAPGGGAVLFHCTAGKDRTGWAAALVLTALGVPRETVMADYLETNDGFLASYTPLLEAWERKGGDPEVMLSALSARPEYLLAAFDEMESTFGGIDGYLVAGLGLDEAVTERLRARILQPC